MQADELVKAGRLDEALAALQQQVRDRPADAKLRVFLFQLLAVMGRWEGELNLDQPLPAAGGMAAVPAVAGNPDSAEDAAGDVLGEACRHRSVPRGGSVGRISQITE